MKEAIPINLSFSLTGTQVRILPENPRRRYCLIVNDSDTVAYISLGSVAAANRGIRLNASGGAYEINLTNPWNGAIYAVSVGVAKVLLVTEWSYALI